MRLTITLFFTLMSFLGFSSLAGEPQINDEYTRHIFVDSLNNSLPYRLLSPSNIEEGMKYPLVLFLHGSGERGDDNEKQLAHGASIFTNPVNAEKYPAYVVFPQCKVRSWTENIDARTFMPGAPLPKESKIEKTVMALLDEIVKTYPIDTDRVYIIGLSMGGIATYDLACRFPDKFAAAIPICGAVNPERLEGAKNVGFLIFHGETDDEIPSLCSRQAYKTLNGLGANVNYVEFAGIGHDCWTSAFNYPSFLSWLFSQAKVKENTHLDGTLTLISEH